MLTVVDRDDQGEGSGLVSHPAVGLAIQVLVLGVGRPMEEMRDCLARCSSIKLLLPSKSTRRDKGRELWDQSMVAGTIMRWMVAAKDSVRQYSCLY